MPPPPMLLLQPVFSRCTAIRTELRERRRRKEKGGGNNNGNCSVRYDRPSVHRKAYLPTA